MGKENKDSTFDVTMGCHGGAEICKLLDVFLLGKLITSFAKENFSLYRDDGLAVLKGASGSEAQAQRIK